jgi:lysophospholipase L1-like esterase
LTTPYSPDTAEAAILGATTAGWVTGGTPTDDLLRYWSVRPVAQRADIMWRAAWDADVARHDEFRATLGITTAPLKVLAIGDSITVGAGSSDGLGYRSLLADLLGVRRVRAAVSMCAEGGITLRVLAPRVPAALAASPPDIALVALGTNDAAMPDLVDYAARLGTLVDTILASSPTVRVVVARPALSNAPWAVYEQQIGGHVDTVVAARAAGGRVRSADMTAVDCSWTTDGIHPMDAGYMVMARQWLRALLGDPADPARPSWLPAPP